MAATTNNNKGQTHRQRVLHQRNCFFQRPVVITLVRRRARAVAPDGGRSQPDTNPGPTANQPTTRVQPRAAQGVPRAEECPDVRVILFT